MILRLLWSHTTKFLQFLICNFLGFFWQSSLFNFFSKFINFLISEASTILLLLESLLNILFLLNYSLLLSLKIKSQNTSSSSSRWGMSFSSLFWTESISRSSYLSNCFVPDNKLAAMNVIFEEFEADLMSYAFFLYCG
jgi:hypothetical protein